MLISFDTPPRRILIIKPSAIGDVVHALPVLALLRRRWPDAHVAWLVTPACAGLVERHPMLDETILFDRKRFGDWWNPWAARDLARFMIALRDRKFDLVIDLQGLLRSGWITGASGATTRVGFADAREGAPTFYTHRIASGGWDRHAVDRYLQVAAALGCGTTPVEFPFAVDDDDRQYVAGLVPGEPFAVLLPGTNWLTKRWPVEHFAQVVEPLRTRFGLTSVVAGGPGDLELASKVPAALSVVGKTSLRQTIALLERAALVIANDSGPMHVAAALGRPLVTPFGPTNPLSTGPYRRGDAVVRLDIPCSPCYSRTCSHQSCLRWLTVESVLRLAEGKLASVTMNAER